MLAQATMQAIYEEVKTPCKYGIVLRGEAGNAVDCPSVFRHQGKWWMLYVCMNVVGYETHLAMSEDLLRWTDVGKVLPFRKEGWDAWQAGGGLALADWEWGGACEPGVHDGKYWLSYVGGALQGYETDPLSIGLAHSEAATEVGAWRRLAANPVMQPSDAKARDFERATLYRSQIIHVPGNATGHRFVMFYNARQQGEWVERIGMAVSDDMTQWERFGDGPVVANGSGISGDPQIVRIGDVWVMFYFGAFWQPKAFDTFACSEDLVHWTRWTGPHLVQPSEPWDQGYAHKPWLLKWQGVVYHFYCAVGDQGRAIALATSEDLRRR